MQRTDLVIHNKSSSETPSYKTSSERPDGYQMTKEIEQRKDNVMQQDFKKSNIPGKSLPTTNSSKGSNSRVGIVGPFMPNTTKCVGNVSKPQSDKPDIEQNKEIELSGSQKQIADEVVESWKAASNDVGDVSNLFIYCN